MAGHINEFAKPNDAIIKIDVNAFPENIAILEKITPSMAKYFKAFACEMYRGIVIIPNNNQVSLQKVYTTKRILPR